MFGVAAAGAGSQAYFVSAPSLAPASLVDPSRGCATSRACAIKAPMVASTTAEANARDAPFHASGIGLGGAAGTAFVAAGMRRSRRRAFHQRRQTALLPRPAEASVETQAPPAPVTAPTAVDTAPAPALAPTLACPVCQGPLTVGCACPKCRVQFPERADGNFLDLTITAATPMNGDKRIASSGKTASATSGPWGLIRKLPGVQQLDSVAGSLGLPTSEDVEGLTKEVVRDVAKVFPRASGGAASVTTFQNPLVSFAYERGWRQNFQLNGFPGPDEEYRLAKEFLEAPLASRHEGTQPPVLLDCSCGSGLFTRRFAADANLSFAKVFALDFSESMLRQANTYAAKEAGESFTKYPRPLQLLRGDVGRLPLQSGSLAGVHAGAAIHCWPAPEIALAELARVLEPGACLVLTTFRKGVVGGRLALGQGNAGNGFRFWEEEELRTLTRQTGLVNFESIQRDPAFIMVKVEKPAMSEAPAAAKPDVMASSQSTIASSPSLVGAKTAKSA